MSKIWYTTFAPETLDEIAGNIEVKDLFKIYLQRGDFPNLLVNGPVGSGKSTIVNLFLQEYLKEHKDRALLRISGALDRGKEAVCSRDQKTTLFMSNSNISNFVEAHISLPKHMFKVVLIDNADWLTVEAQNALRRIMELHSRSVRFILVATNVSDIIEAVQSRCNVVTTNIFSEMQTRDAINAVLQKAGYSLPEQIIDSILLLSEGDVCRAMSYVQVACSCTTDEGETSLDKFYSVFNLPPITNIRRIINNCYHGRGTRSYEIAEQLLDNGYNPVDILNIAIKVLVKNTHLPRDVKTRYLESACYCLYRIEKQQNKSNYIYHWIATVSLPT